MSATSIRRFGADWLRFATAESPLDQHHEADCWRPGWWGLGPRLSCDPFIITEFIYVNRNNRWGMADLGETVKTQSRPHSGYSKSSTPPRRKRGERNTLSERLDMHRNSVHNYLRTIWD